MWKLIKFLLICGVVALIVLSVIGYKVNDRTIPEYFKDFLSRSDTKEKFKDIRQMVGEAIKAVGAELADDVSDEEREQLNKLVKEELNKGAPLKETEKVLEKTEKKDTNF